MESTVNLHSLNFHWHFTVTFLYFILKKSLCSCLISLPVMQALFCLIPNMRLTTNYCVIVPPKSLSVRDFPSEPITKYRQDYHNFRAGVLKASGVFCFEPLGFAKLPAQVMNDTNNLYHLQNKKSLDCFQSKLVALQQMLTSFFLSKHLFFVFTGIIFQQKKKTIQNYLRDRSCLRNSRNYQKQLFKHPTFFSPPEMFMRMHITLNT